MHRRSGDGVALLGVMGNGAAQGADVIAFLAGNLGATGGAVPGVAIALARFADSRAGWLLSKQMTGGSIRVARGQAILAWMVSGTTAAKDAAPDFKVV